jgi:acetyltransferase-like isoleucine patch superfamily enzyme
MILLTWMEGLIMPNRSFRIFGSCKEVLSLVPTIVGEYMRLAYYWAVCTGVSPDVCFMFGSMAAHRNTIVRSGTVIGVYTIIGRADIGKNVLFGARVSLLSGKYQHGRPGERAESRETPMDFQLIKIGDNSWIGQDSIIMANVGENCTVGAGSVVYKEVPNNTTVLGNPARKVNL